MFLVVRYISTHDNSPSTTVKGNYDNNMIMQIDVYCLLCKTEFYRDSPSTSISFEMDTAYNTSALLLPKPIPAKQPTYDVPIFQHHICPD